MSAESHWKRNGNEDENDEGEETEQRDFHSRRGEGVLTDLI